LIILNMGRLGTIQSLPAFWPLLFILVLATFSLFYARHMAYGVRLDMFMMVAKYKNHLLEPFLIYSAGFIIAMRMPNDLRPLYITAIAFALLNIVALSVFATGLNPFGASVMSHDNTRFASFGGLANQGAYSMLLFIPLFYYLYEKSRGQLAKTSFLIFIFTSLAGIGLSGSRGGYLLVLIVFLLLMYTTKRYKFFMAVAGAGVFFLIAYAATFDLDLLINAVSRLETLSGGEELHEFQKHEGFSNVDQISAGRTWIWKGIYEVMVNDPLSIVLGKGWGTYRPHIQAVLGIAPAAHNVFLLYLLELGLIGLGLLCFAGYQYVRFMRRRLHKQDRLLYHCIMIMMLVVVWAFLLAAPVNLYKIWGFLFGLLAGYVISLQVGSVAGRSGRRASARIADSDASGAGEGERRSA